jgi:hypothetical protein
MNPFGHMVSEISSTVIICFFVSEVVLNICAAEEKGHLNKTSTLDDASSSAAIPPFPQRRKQR